MIVSGSRYFSNSTVIENIFKLHVVSKSYLLYFRWSKAVEYGYMYIILGLIEVHATLKIPQGDDAWLLQKREAISELSSENLNHYVTNSLDKIW